MIREVKFESQERRIKQILAALNQYGIKDIEEANAICDQYGLDPYKACEETQPICFENAKWAYVVGSAIALKKGCKTAAEAAEAIGIGLQAFCIPGSLPDADVWQRWPADWRIPGSLAFQPCGKLYAGKGSELPQGTQRREPDAGSACRQLCR